MNRRNFLLHTGTFTAAAVVRPSSAPLDAAPAAPQGTGTAGGAGADDRAYWRTVATRLADPVLVSLAARTLKASMPVESAPGAEASRVKVSHLEAFGRLLTGLAPWLELPPDDTPEGRERARYRTLALQALAAATDPKSPDFLNFTEGRQPLVDAAFLAQAILRAPRALWESVEATTRGHVIKALESTRIIQPGFNNWLLFSATVEAALKRVGVFWDRMRVDYALRQHEQWYVGDGVYGDGPQFHWDYYNSFVIQPMLLDVLDACADDNEGWAKMRPVMLKRAQRYAAIQERLISPEGTYPPIGRSIAYRYGAFQVLADMARRRTLPDGVTPPMARAALTKIVRRGTEAPGTFDDRGWLRIGFCGHQPGVGETYISTGSLYLCSVGLLPLGLPPDDAFWSAPAEPTTAERAWSGKPFPIDKALPSTV